MTRYQKQSSAGQISGAAYISRSISSALLFIIGNLRNYLQEGMYIECLS